jgi:signal transduction histidine kinase
VIAPAPGADDSGRAPSTRWLEAALEITRSFLSEPFEPVLQGAVDRAADLAQADVVALALAGADGLEVRAARSMSGTADGRARPVPPDRVTLDLLATGRPVTGAGPVDVLTAVAPETVVRRFAGVPFTSAGAVVGVLYAGRTGPSAFDEWVVGLLREFTDQVALALQAARAADERIRRQHARDRDATAADLHDHVIQSLFHVAVDLTSLAATVGDDRVTRRLERDVDHLDDAIVRIRTAIGRPDERSPREDRTSLSSRLMTVIDQAVPALGFRPAARIPAVLDTVTADEGCSRLRDDLVAVTREALSNVARHAAARTATVDVDVTDKEIIVVVADDGRGLRAPRRNSGLRYAQMRAERHGGSFGVRPAGSGGTVFTWRAAKP